ncbi:MAG: hypothetical protein IT503_18320 [Burkholderiaceae bacterium]|nr:MAG: hypothetical protein F9K36_00700 [Burkholderiaceae bacterium]MBE7425644.1 hypothetical protein [Ideonella sp.]MCC7288133.1 hypothetical protein [Burkholderiaceae bacterium]
MRIVHGSTRSWKASTISPSRAVRDRTRRQTHGAVQRRSSQGMELTIAEPMLAGTVRALAQP